MPTSRSRICQVHLRFAQRALFASWLLAVASLAGCVREEANFGGESNWFSTCDSDTDCTQGSCICGVCTTPCSNDSECSKLGHGECVGLSAAPLTDACESRVDEPGVCLATCSDTDECPKGERCSAGACVPEPTGSNSRDASVTADADVRDAAGTETLTSAEGDASMTVAESSAPVTSNDAGGQLESSLDGSMQSNAIDAADTKGAEACGYRYLGEWTYCGGTTWSPGSAETLAECMTECNATPDCVAVADSSWVGPASYSDPCTLQLGATCVPREAPQVGGHPNERSYEKICQSTAQEVRNIESWASAQPGPGYSVDSSSPCHFEWLGGVARNGPWLACEGYGSTELESTRGQTLEECFATCDAAADCTGVLDWGYAPDRDYRCVTYVGTCDSPRTTTDGVHQFVKICETE